MVLSGEIIAVFNIAEKCPVLFPRGQAFLTPLSGEIIAVHGQQSLTTTVDLTREVCRGEAVRVQGWWYRVSQSTIGKSRTPLSVTLDKPLGENLKKPFVHRFTSKSLPLDGVFLGEDNFTGVLYRHGVSSDLRELWKRSREEMPKDTNDRKKFRRQLLKEGLVTLEIDNTVTVKKEKGPVKQRRIAPRP
jgi:hypothetical protein